MDQHFNRIKGSEFSKDQIQVKPAANNILVNNLATVYTHAVKFTSARSVV